MTSLCRRNQLFCFFQPKFSKYWRFTALLMQDFKCNLLYLWHLFKGTLKQIMYTHFPQCIIVIFFKKNPKHIYTIWAFNKQLTAYPLTAAITGFLQSATLFQWFRKFPLILSEYVLFCISFMSAPIKNILHIYHHCK